MTGDNKEMSDEATHRRKASQTRGAYCLPGPEMIALLDEIERLRAELERLSAALKGIADNKTNSRAWLEDTARRALEGKE